MIKSSCCQGFTRSLLHFSVDLSMFYKLGGKVLLFSFLNIFHNCCRISW